MLAIAEELTEDGFVLRYRTDETDDGLSGKEGTFLICSFWLVSALAIVGELQQARDLMERLLRIASPLGLYAEEFDAATGRHLGNFPQAFSHLALMEAAGADHAPRADCGGVLEHGLLRRHHRRHRRRRRHARAPPGTVRASGSCCSSGATGSRASPPTGSPRTSSSTTTTCPRTPGTTPTASRSNRRSTTSSAARRSSTARRSTAFVRRTSASCIHHDGPSPAWPISYDDLEPYYTQAEQLYEVHGARGEDPTEPYASAPYPFPAVSHEPRIQQLSDDLAAAGYHPFHAPCGVRLNEQNMPYGACVRCQNCDGFPCACTASPTLRSSASGLRSSTRTSSC